MARRISLTTLSLALALLLASSALAQRGGARGRGGFGGNLLDSPEVQQELELLDDQVEQLQSVNEKIREKMTGMFSELRNLPREEMMAKFGKLREELTSMRDTELQGILLPSQVKRLKQIEFQQRMTRGGSGRAFENPDLMQQLGLSDEQLEQIRKLAADAQVEMREKIAKLQKEAQDKILSVLTPQQRKDFDDLFGQPFEFPQPQPQQRPAGGAATRASSNTATRVETE